MVGHRSLIPVWSLDIRGRRYSGRYGLAVVREVVKGYNLCHVFVLICSFKVQFSIFSWADLKDMMRQAGEVTYTDAHQRMVSIRGPRTRSSGSNRPDKYDFRVKIEAKSVSLTEKRFMLQKRNLMAKNVTVSF